MKALLSCLMSLCLLAGGHALAADAPANEPTRTPDAPAKPPPGFTGEWGIPGADITIVFDGQGGVSGFSGCNRFMATYTSKGRQLKLDRIGGTRMMCSPELMQAERDFLAQLAQVARFRKVGPEVRLMDEHGKVVLKLKRVPR